MIHFLKKFAGDRKAGAFADHRVNTAVRAARCTVLIARIIVNDSFFNFYGSKDFTTVKAPADGIPLELSHVVITKEPLNK